MSSRQILIVLICSFSVSIQSTRADSVVGMVGVSSLSAGYDLLIELGQDVDRPEIQKFLDQKLAKVPQIEGLDRNAPVAAFLVQAGVAPPMPVVALPISDLQTVRDSLSKLKIKLQNGDQEGTWTVKLPKRTVQVRQLDQHLIISENVVAMKLVTPSVLDDVQQQLADNHIVGAVYPQSIHPTLIDVAIQAFMQGLEKERSQKPEEGDRIFALRQRIVDGVEFVGESILRETTEVRFAANLRDMHFYFNWQVEPDQNLSQLFESLSVDHHASESQAGDALQLKLAVNLPQPVRNLLLDASNLLQEQARKKVAGHLKPEERMPASEIFDTLNSTIEQGVLNADLRVVANETQRMSILLGVKAENPAGFQNTLQTLLPYIEQSDDYRSIDRDVIRTDDVQIHAFNAKSVSKKDQKLYGDDVAIYVGTNADQVWLAAGNPDTKRCLTERMSEELADTESSALFDLQFDLTPWINLAELNGDTDETLRILQGAFEDDDDQIHALVTNNENTLGLQVELEPGYRRALGIVLGELARRRGANAE